MKKRLSLYLAALLLAPCAPRAEEGDVIEVVYQGTEATVSIPETADVSAIVSGAHVTLNSSTSSEEYVYRLSGTTDDGSLTLNGAYKLTLQLDGVSIVSQQGAAIDVETGKRVAVVLTEGTENTLTDAAGGSHKAALYFTGHPEFEGSGTLNVTGRTKHAISAKEYLQLKKTTGTINVLGAVSDGIHCGKGKVNNEHRYFQINGGIVNIANVGGDCIDSDDYGVMYLRGGIINANVSGFDATGLKCDSIIYMTDGIVNLDVTGDEAVGMKANYDMRLTGGLLTANVAGNGAKGIKGKRKTAASTVLDGGTVTLGGTDCTFYVHGNDILAADGSVDTNTRAISADADLLRSGGDIEVFAYGSMEAPCHADGQESTEGGTLTLHRAPWNFYHGDFRHDMTSYVELHVGGRAVGDYTDYAIGAFIGDVCAGVALDGYLRIHSNETTAQAVTFRVYDYSAAQEYEPTASKEVTFAPSALTGTPADPVILNLGASTPGDINRDGQVTLADVTALVEVWRGNDDATPHRYDHTAADLTGDGSISVEDVKRLVKYILNRK